MNRAELHRLGHPVSIPCASSTCFQGLADSRLAWKDLEASKPSRSVKSIRSAERCWRNTGRRFPALTMFEPLEEMRSLPLTSSAEAFPARIFQTPAFEEALRRNALAFGRRLPVWLASFDRPTSSWRTSQLCLMAQLSGQGDGLAEFWGTWPRSGMMRSGTAYQLPTLAPLTSEIASGLLPTPRKNDSQKRGNFDVSNSRNGFPAAVKRLFLPTIGKNEPKCASRNRFRGSPHFRGAKMCEGLRICEDDPIYLHPSFAEASMGFPIGWTELEAAETQ